MDELYLEKKINIIIISIILIGALNYGIIGMTNTNLIKKLDDISGVKLSIIIYLIIGLSALYLLFSRDTYLPFLGDTVYPCGSLEMKIPDNATETQVIKVPPNSIVVYWGSEPKNEELNTIQNVWNAYQNYENTGVTQADENGNAILKFRKPQSYIVPNKRIIKPHVHYRYCKNPGMLSQVETVYM
jgi:uncharacterized membrane protein YuzA (DUF378 family)